MGRQTVGIQAPSMINKITLTVCALPVVSTVYEIAVSPGYILPFLTNPSVWLFLALSVLWLILWGWVVLQTDSILMAWVVCLFCLLPLSLIPILAPSILTILNALEPVFQQLPKTPQA
jgi:hypothetical protein